MFDHTSKTKALVELGSFLHYFLEDASISAQDQWALELETLMHKSELENPWFTQNNLRFALKSWADSFRQEALNSWLNEYDFSDIETQKRVGIVAAGNVPLVAWHDIMCVWLSGHKALVKLSSKDRLLIPFFVKFLAQFHAEIPNAIQFVERLEQVDAAICTGSNNTSRYFDYYFRNVANIIRSNRTSVAVLTGEESDEELQLLGEDIFRYFGLGCRNITKLYIPTDFDINRVFGAIYPHHEIVNHHKYANNYDYHRAILLMNLDEVLDNGFIVFKEDAGIHSPVGTLFYERYHDISKLRNDLKLREDELQCVVTKSSLWPDAVDFGQTQCPTLSDYADGVDTMDFLLKI